MTKAQALKLNNHDDVIVKASKSKGPRFETLAQVLGCGRERDGYIFLDVVCLTSGTYMTLNHKEVR